MSALVLNPGHSHAEVTEIVRTVRTGRTNQEGSEGTVEVASFNSSSQVILAGSRDGILRASEMLKELEIASRAADLPVSSVSESTSFHLGACADDTSLQCTISLLIHEASSVRYGTCSHLRCRQALDAICTPRIWIRRFPSHFPILLGLESRRSNLAPRRWSTCINSLPTTHGIRRLVFLGPGQALANLARRDHKLLREAREASPSASQQEKDELETEVVSVATEKDMDKLVEVWNTELSEASK